MLRFHVRNLVTDDSFCHLSGPYEFGRGPRRDIDRYVLNDPTVSRNQLRVEELTNGSIRLENISHSNPVLFDDGTSLDRGVSREFQPPLSLSVGRTRIEIDALSGEGAGGAESESGKVYETVLAPWCQSPYPSPSLRDLGDSPSAQKLTKWLEMALQLQQTAEDLPDLYARTAHAVVELVGLDFAQVLLRESGDWAVLAQCAKDDLGHQTTASRTLLTRLVNEGQTLFHSPTELPTTASLQTTTAVVASPIFGVGTDVIGALYGARTGLSGTRSQEITELEAQVIQLFAAAASTRRARTEATRMRVQFEQFFSPELVRELHRNPDLLEGRMQEVTVLVSDLRGFSRLSERLGPQKTCQVVRDVMERFTLRIIEHGGVIVDYAGDGILAMWNAPVPQENHPQRACRAALAIREELPGLNKKWEDLADGQLDAGIGVNTGLALVGNTGSHRRLKYGPHGHTVNLASRLQDATKKLNLPTLITCSTRAQLPAEFAVRRLCIARLRGIQGTAVLHELHGRNPPADWQRTRDIYESALREYEAGAWCKACQSLLGLMELDQTEGQLDIPTVKLLRKTWECLEQKQDIDPVVDLT